jgi:hypothetical protein
VGVANYLAGRKDVLLRSDAFGKAFEHFIIQEIRAYLSYKNADQPMTYWRTTGGSHEVDCIVGTHAAIEVKGTDRVNERMLTGLKALQEEQLIENYFLVSRDPESRQYGQIKIVHYEKFLSQLWNGVLF